MSNSKIGDYFPSPSAVLSRSPPVKKPRLTIRILDSETEDMQSLVTMFKKQMRDLREQQEKERIYQTYIRYITANQCNLTTDIVNDLQNSIITQAQNDHLTNDQEIDLLLFVENMYLKNISIYNQLKYHITTSCFTEIGSKMMNDRLICHFVDGHITRAQKKELCDLIKLIPVDSKSELPLIQQQLNTVYTVSPKLMEEQNIIALFRITVNGTNYFKISIGFNGLSQLLQAVKNNYNEDVMIISVFSEKCLGHLSILYNKLTEKFGSNESHLSPSVLATFVSYAIVSNVKYINNNYVINDEYTFDDLN